MKWILSPLGLLVLFWLTRKLFPGYHRAIRRLLVSVAVAGWLFGAWMMARMIHQLTHTAMVSLDIMPPKSLTAAQLEDLRAKIHHLDHAMWARSLLFPIMRQENQRTLNLIWLTIAPNSETWTPQDYQTWCRFYNSDTQADREELAQYVQKVLHNLGQPTSPKER